MAVAEPTPILARSLIAQYIRIPALVQTPSFLRNAKPIHLFLRASRHPSYSHLQLRGVQFSQVLFTPKRASLYLVTGLSVRLPRSAVRGLNAVLLSTSHNQFLFKVSSSFTTTPLVTLDQYYWQVRKNLYQPNAC